MTDTTPSSEGVNPPETNLAVADNEHPQGQGLSKPSRNSIIFGGLLLVAVGIILNTWGLLPFGQSTVTTDNAYLKGDVTVISPQVGGYVTAVNVSDFDSVEEGQVLLTIDDRRFNQRLLQADAQISSDQAALTNVALDRRSANAQVRLREANVTTARAQVARLESDYDRVSTLLPSGAVSQREHDQIKVALQNAKSNLTQALAQLDVARSQLGSVDVGQRRLRASLSGASATRELAQIDLDNSTITAPRSGSLSEVSVQVGQLVSPGTQLMFLVPDETWVVANFREADAAKIKIGQGATIRVDALDGQEFEGKVTGVAPAAGSEFSLIQPDNDTGNFIKVAQRIAVRIGISPGQEGLASLRPGMSVEASVDTASEPNAAAARQAASRGEAGQ